MSIVGVPKGDERGPGVTAGNGMSVMGRYNRYRPLRAWEWARGFWVLALRFGFCFARLHFVCRVYINVYL